MTSMKLVPQKLTYELLCMLEERGCVRMLAPTEAIAKDPQCDAVDSMYTSDPAFGGHKLLCVRKNALTIEFAVHSENEEVIFINNTGQTYKPLYLIMALCSVEELEEKFRNATVTAEDILALEVDFNDPRTCVFTVLKNVPHYEVTVPGDGEAPVFYVTEPTDIDMRILDKGGYSFTLETDA